MGVRNGLGVLSRRRTESPLTFHARALALGRLELRLHRRQLGQHVAVLLPGEGPVVLRSAELFRGHEVVIDEGLVGVDWRKKGWSGGEWGGVGG